MQKTLLLLISLAFVTLSNAQYKDNTINWQPVDALPARIPVERPHVGMGSKNDHSYAAHKGTAGTSTYSDWYDLWDEMYDTTSTTLPHSYQYIWNINTDSNIHDLSGYYPPYYLFTHGIGMSFDPSDSAYYYHAYDTAYRVSAPFNYLLPYTLDSFWVPGEYFRYDPTTTNVDSFIVEFLVTQNGGTPDSGAYALVATAPAAMYRPFTHDSLPRFATARYFRAADECVDPVLTTTAYQRYAFPLTATDAFIYRIQKFNLPTPLVVPPHKYLAAYVYFKSQTAYPLGTSSYAANYYQLYAGEPNGTSTWFPQSAHNNATGYPGSHQQGLIATNQIRYNDLGFTFNSHNVLLPASAYANTGANLPPGFSVPHMAFHITWSATPSLGTGNTTNTDAIVNVFPNPASSRLNITYTLPQNSNVKISFLNAIGQVIAVRQADDVSNGNASFNTSTLPAGLYTYLFEAEGLRKTGKVLVVH